MKLENLRLDIIQSQRKTSTHLPPESYLDRGFDQHGNLNSSRYPLRSLKSQYYFLYPLEEVIPPSLKRGNNSISMERDVQTGRYTYEHASVHYGNKHSCPNQAWQKSSLSKLQVQQAVWKACTSKFPKRKQCQNLTTTLTYHLPNALDILTCC